MDYKTEKLKSIQTMVDRTVSNRKVDHTYRSVVKKIVKEGYVIVDSAGCERTVRCCIPGVSLKAGQNVWVKEPMGDIGALHICGVC